MLKLNLFMCLCVRNIWHIKEKTFINVIRIYMLLVQFEILKIFQDINIFAVMFIIMILNQDTMVKCDLLQSLLDSYLTEFINSYYFSK